jgi:hypothetical protein
VSTSAFTIHRLPQRSTATNTTRAVLAALYAAFNASKPVASGMRTAGQGNGIGCMRGIVPGMSKQSTGEVACSGVAYSPLKPAAQ